MNNKWYLKNVGEICEEIILVYGNEPVLFVCQDHYGARYLFETISYYDGKFVACRISNNELLKLLNNKITMYDVFHFSQELLVTFFDDDYALEAEIKYSEDIPDAMFPRKGVYFGLSSELINGYIHKLEKEETTFMINYTIRSPKFKVSKTYDGSITFKIDKKTQYNSMSNIPLAVKNKKNWFSSSFDAYDDVNSQEESLCFLPMSSNSVRIAS